ncbi:hypothetical protein O7543_28010 [Solwaraspora sp. WMMA2080]|uniref:hypothetical protein n=1 Tax=unclassified Solwaraspora TaxID=2627926 RepID=UPI00248B3E3F|nr:MULTISPECIES: hypothetical protein [unclassified Solwaraspora]WBB95528.1 hypothetical protein O7553_19355 [Solwaraspora sp. WMMA2059]WBC20567.1 hypothetical protein O7543_28010 [Solwaraspora sp. WMMA2080]
MCPIVYTLTVGKAALVPPEIEELAGPEMGGIAVGRHIGLPGAIVRKTAKEYGAAWLAEGAAVAGRGHPAAVAADPRRPRPPLTMSRRLSRRRGAGGGDGHVDHRRDADRDLVADGIALAIVWRTFLDATGTHSASAAGISGLLTLSIGNIAALSWPHQPVQQRPTVGVARWADLVAKSFEFLNSACGIAPDHGGCLFATVPVPALVEGSLPVILRCHEIFDDKTLKKVFQGGAESASTNWEVDFVQPVYPLFSGLGKVAFECLVACVDLDMCFRVTGLVSFVVVV